MLEKLTIQSPELRRFIELMDVQFQQNGMPTFKELEKTLINAIETNNRIEEGRIALRIGLQLSAIATLSKEALTSAIEYFHHALDVSRNENDIQTEKLARERLAQCLVQSEQYETALEQLTLLVKLLNRQKDLLLCFNTYQLIGDCNIQLVNDEQALSWYQQAMEVAREIGDPFEIQVQYGKIAGALSNLKRYDEALRDYNMAVDILLQLEKDRELQQKIVLHKNVFNPASIPVLINYVNERINNTKEALGRDLLRELPREVAQKVIAAKNQIASDHSDWSVLLELDTAVRSAASVLAKMLEETTGNKKKVIAKQSTLKMVGSLCRHYFDSQQSDPKDIISAARLIMQADRFRRAAYYIKKAEESEAGAGPFGGGSSSLVIYLRSFIASSRLPSFLIEPWGHIGLEEFLTCMLDQSPLIALGNAEMQQYGPGRAVTTDDNWRRALKKLASEAQMIIVIPAPTEGTSWEIEWAVTNKFLHKTCFIMPPPAKGDEVWWTENWDKLQNWSVRLGVNLPEYKPSGCIFRLTSEGLFDEMAFDEIYLTTPDLHTNLLTQLLFKPNISYDFLYGMQQGLESEKTEEEAGSLRENIDGVSSEHMIILQKIEMEKRFEFSNWDFDEPIIPKLPGVLMFFETPFRLLWADEVNDLHEVLSQYVKGHISDFTRNLFQSRILPLLNTKTINQIKEKSLSVETIMSFRIKQMISYRFLIVEDAKKRVELKDIILRGTSKFGKPQLLRDG